MQVGLAILLTMAFLLFTGYSNRLMTKFDYVYLLLIFVQQPHHSLFGALLVTLPGSFSINKSLLRALSAILGLVGRQLWALLGLVLPWGLSKLFGTLFQPV